MSPLKFSLLCALFFVQPGVFAQAITEISGTYFARPRLGDVPWAARFVRGGLYADTSSLAPVYVIDSGVRRHPSINVVQRATIGVSSSGVSVGTEGCNPHGTFVAGILGGKGLVWLDLEQTGVRGTLGVIPGLPIFSIAVHDGCTPNSTPSGDDVLKAIIIARTDSKNRCIYLGDCRPRVVNLSLNGEIFEPAKTNILNALKPDFRRFYPGLLLIQSAGNDMKTGTDAANRLLKSDAVQNDGYIVVGAIDEFGQQMQNTNGLPLVQSTLAPADTGGIDDTRHQGRLWFIGSSRTPQTPADADSVVSGSNYGSVVDMWAPGKNMRGNTFFPPEPNLVCPQNISGQGVDTLIIYTGPEDGYCYGEGYGSGTSFAAPVVSAIAAYVTNQLGAFEPLGNFEMYIRNLLRDLKTTDLAGMPIKVPQIHTELLGAQNWSRPTAEFLVANQIANFYADTANQNPSQFKQTGFTIRAKSAFNIAFEAFNSRHCSIKIEHQQSSGAITTLANETIVQSAPERMIQKKIFGLNSFANPLPLGTVNAVATCYDPVYSAYGAVNPVDGKTYRVSSTAALSFTIVAP